MAKKDDSTAVINSPSPGAGSTNEQRQEEIERRFWKAVDRIQNRNADQEPDQVLADVTEVVEEVRQERYEREQRKAHGHY